jgi:hypothetical protein
MQPSEFINQFAFGGLLSIAVGSVTSRSYTASSDFDATNLPFDKEIYFGPAMCQRAGGSKEDTLGTKVLWVDVDNINRPQCTLPPSMVVFSGHGWHLYWILKEPLLDPEKIETLNKTLIEDISTADKACWNCNRVLRVPGSTNRKEADVPIEVALKVYKPTITYAIKDFEVLSKLSKQNRHKISTGDIRGYRSRSERDWAVLSSLVLAGASDNLITLIYNEQPVGEKARENPHYLAHTIETVRAKDLSPEVDAEMEERPEGYFIPARKGWKRISTFLFEPSYLLDGSAFHAADALVGDVTADAFTWKDITFSRSAFTSVTRMDKEAPVAAWQWLGHDDDLRKLLPYLLLKLKAKGLPKVAATPVMGLHNIKNRWCFLGDLHTLNSDQCWPQFQGAVCWLPTQREHPELDLIPEVTDEEIKLVAESLPLLNDPETIWPMIGWYTASCLKPWFEKQNYRFPILNVTGTKGSGKTTLIQRIFMPLMGQTSPKTYDANTTRFVILSLMGSTNAVPIAFSEFRYGSVENFIRFILLSYDTGHDPRGKGDQTTVDYPLSAPFSVDGEDIIDDPAARERIIVAQLHPGSIDEDTEPYKVFQHLRKNMPTHFGGYMIQQILKREPQLLSFLTRARNAVFTAFPAKFPDRVRNNHIVAYVGILLWCDILGVQPPSASVLQTSIASVFDLESGRARTLADSLAEDLINGIAQGFAHMNHFYDSDANVLWFQLAPAHSWWITSRRRQGRGALERDAIRAQLKEAPYSVTPQVVNDAWMFGIDLAKASECGLDVPSRIGERAFVMRLGN